MVEGNAGAYYHAPQIVYAPQGVPMQYMTVDPASMENFSRNAPAYYAHSNVSLGSSPPSGSGSVATMVAPPPVTMSNPVPTNAMYPMPMYGVPMHFNQPQHHQQAVQMVDKNRKMSPTFSSTSSYGSGGY